MRFPTRWSRSGIQCSSGIENKQPVIEAVPRLPLRFLSRLFPVTLDDGVLTCNYQTFCSGISFLQTLQTFVPLGYLALQFGQTIGFTKSVRAAACSGVLSGIRYHLLLKVQYEGLKLLKNRDVAPFPRVEGDLTLAASPLVVVRPPNQDIIS